MAGSPVSLLPQVLHGHEGSAIPVGDGLPAMRRGGSSLVQIQPRCQQVHRQH